MFRSQTVRAIAALGELPVGLLPGNHEAATADSVLKRLELSPSVRVPAERVPVRLNSRAWYC